MRILIIIPGYNIASHLNSVLAETKRFSHDILVVDDGSTDNTANIAIEEEIALLSHPFNRGKGAALKAGFAFALEHNYEAVITLDGDGQHDPKYIPEFIARYEQTGADLIIGSRIHDKADMPWDRKLSNFLTSKALSLLLGIGIEDSQCGYRFITTRLLRKIRLKTDRFELESEIIIKAAVHGFKIRFVSITVLYGRNFPTAMRRVVDTFRWLKMVLEEL